jgi:NAD(P)-dependent dehydrogenase (short-subunit alcohol dehydrogenase family)
MSGSNEKPLIGQVAVVTGAGRGIGASIARELARMGAAVVLCGRTREQLDATAAAISKAGGNAEAVICDVSDLNSVNALAALVEKKHGRVDILVNNAGRGSVQIAAA